jgi:alpha,alpha-trehalase
MRYYLSLKKQLKKHNTISLVIITMFLFGCSIKQTDEYQSKYADHWQQVKDTILFNWHHSKVDSTTWQMPGSLHIPLEYFSIHEGRNVLFGWDTYFTNAGLLVVDKYAKYAKNAATNQMSEISQLGYVPNASEPWGHNRSQIPFLAMMVREVYEHDEVKDKEWLKSAYVTLKKEYKFWTNTSDDAIEDHNTPVRGLQRFFHHATDEELITQYDNLCTRFGFSTEIPDKQKIEFIVPWISEAESGMDFTPRFEHRCHEFIAVDLNANLYMYEINFAWIVNELNLQNEPDWKAKADVRKELLNKYCWSEERNLYLDYDFVNRRHSKVACVTSFYPMWAGMATPKQAKAMINNLSLFEYEYGPTICERTEQERIYQWDFPAGWPPMYYIVVKALDNYGYKTEARRIAAKYLDIVAKNFIEPLPAAFTNKQKGIEKTETRASGYVYEKYNAFNGTIYDAEYPSRPFHGWSYGVYVWCLDYYNKTQTKGVK